MIFDLVRRITGGQAVDPDPRTDPGDVLAEAIIKMPLTLRNSDTIPESIKLTLEGTALQTATVRVWALDDVAPDRLASAPTREQPTLADLQARQFYECTSAPLVVTVAELIQFPFAADDVMPGPGVVYFQLTVVPAADAILKVAPSN